MSLSKFESEIKYLSQPIETVYDRYADLRNLEGLKERLNDPEVISRLASQVPADKVEEMKKYAQSMTFDADSLNLSTPMGAITLRIVEREAPKYIKFQSEGSPLPLYVGIQLLPHGEAETKMRITVGAEVNFFMKGMVSKPLKQAAEGLANILSMVR